VPFAHAAGQEPPRHDIDGYKSGDRLRLEHGMGIAADQLCAMKTVKAKGGGPILSTTTGYALEVKLTYVPFGLSGQKKTVTLAPELDEGDTPVRFPSDMNINTATLKVDQLVRTCTGYKAFDIGKTGEIIWKERSMCDVKDRGKPPVSHSVTLITTGNYASVGYSRTDFELDTSPAGACQPATLGAAQITEPSLGTADAFEFRAEAWAAGGSPGAACSSSRPALQTVGSGDAVAVYLDDPSPSTVARYNRLGAYGTRELSAVVWPRVEGTRGGHPFTYAARTPPLVRDRLSVCATGMDRYGAANPHTFHRAPFAPGSSTWMVTQGNEDDPGNYQADGVTPVFVDWEGDGQTNEPYHGSGQRYETDLINDSDFDGSAELDHPIRASRAGYVVLIDRDEKGNANTGNNETGAKDVTNYKGVGNYIWIRHADGTHATYNHLRFDSVPANIVLGTWVPRGRQIAKTGNTGYSSTAHLHWGTFTATSIPEDEPTKYLTKVPLRTEDANHPAGCWVPREQEFVNSNNVATNKPPFFDHP
jgi:murein DD-endopeptidase MepM/ murein hydrolase activator NlpD